MGEEEKKKPVEPQKEEKSPEAEKKVATEGEAEEGKKSEELKAENQAATPPPPPPEIVLKVYMHCEGCARKVRQCLKGFEGVEEVITDCKANKVVVRGEGADPRRVLERVQRKSHRQVQLISPISTPLPPPPPPEDEPKKTADEPQVPKVEEEKLQEPAVYTVVLGVYMHCEACAQEIKKRILRLKGVESAEPDLKSSQVKVKGTIQPELLVDYVHKRMGKHATIVKSEPANNADEKPAEAKKPSEGEAPAKEAAKEGGGEPETENKEEAGVDPPPPTAEAAAAAEEESSKLELRKNELYHYYPQHHHHQLFYHPQGFQVQEYYAYPPQMFSDENPNACTVM